MATISNLAPDSKFSNNTTMFSSRFRKTVSLHDWWLIKADNDCNGKILAVGGLESRGCKATRIFSSAPIVKRYDMLNLETADGITVFINGFINKARTLENGISFEVCDHFLIGFPYNWEDLNYHCGEGSAAANIFCEASGCSKPNDGEVEVVSSTSNPTSPFDARRMGSDNGPFEARRSNRLKTLKGTGNRWETERN